MLIASQVSPRMLGSTGSRMHRPMAAVLIACGMALYGVGAGASQESVEEVAKLLQQGNAAQAAKQAESYLKQNPNDVQMRFMQGVAAAEQKQNAQAIKIFSALTRDYPNLPEPYNNLAVLYAAQGQERKATEVLEQAIRTNPSYATAHENLGDLYARMASDAYSKALQLDGARQAVQPKLALITQIFPRQSAPAAAVVAQSAGAKVAAPKPEAKSGAAQVAEGKSVPAVATTAVAATAMAAAAVAVPATAAVTVAKASEPQPAAPQPVKARVAEEASGAAPAKSAGAQESKPAQAVEHKVAEEKPKLASASALPAADKPVEAEKKVVADAAARPPAVAEVESAVNAWAEAWAGQDIGRYLEAYSDKFTPADGSSLSKWKETRRQRIVGKSSISVTLQDLKVAVEGEQATARFRQHYVAGALKATTRKILKLQREGGRWRITHEGTGA